jgi:hypothetical protein
MRTRAAESFFSDFGFVHAWFIFFFFVTILKCVQLKSTRTQVHPPGSPSALNRRLLHPLTTKFASNCKNYLLIFENIGLIAIQNGTNSNVYWGLWGGPDPGQNRRRRLFGRVGEPFKVVIYMIALQRSGWHAG